MSRTLFNFYLDDDLRKAVEDYASKQKPKESITRVIHKALYTYLDRNETTQGDDL